MLIFPAAFNDSGHKSWTHKKAFALNKKEAKIPIYPTVIGDGALTGGLAYEGINNLGYHKTQLTIVLNDNSMSISKSVGAVSKYLNRVVTNPTYNKLRNDIWICQEKYHFQNT